MMDLREGDFGGVQRLNFRAPMILMMIREAEISPVGVLLITTPSCGKEAPGQAGRCG